MASVAQASFEEWRKEFEAELLRRTRLTWADASGDEQVLQDYYKHGDPPLETVLWYIDKYGLDDIVANEWLA